MRPLNGDQRGPVGGGGGLQRRRTTHFHRRAKWALVYTDDTAHHFGSAIPPCGAPDRPVGRCRRPS